MRDLARQGAADSRVYQLASWVGSAEGLEDFLRSHFFYRAEHEEVVRSVPRMLSDLEAQGHIEGDCDDISTFICAVLAAMGISCRFVAIRYGGSEEFLHVFPEYRAPWEWIALDVTVPSGTVHEFDERMVVDVV